MRVGPIAAGIVIAACALFALSGACLAGQALSDLHGLVSPRAALILTTGAIATGLSYAVEDPDAAEEFLSRGALDAISDAGNVYGSTLFLAPAALVTWSLASAFDDGRLAKTGRDALEAIVLAQCVVAPMKVVVDRERPDGDRYSFPSGHAANAVSVVPILWRAHGAGVGLVASGLALCTALGRQEDRRHYLSDVVGGATIGFLIGDTIGRRAAEEETASRAAAEGGIPGRNSAGRRTPRLEVSPRAVSLGWTW